MGRLSALKHSNASESSVEQQDPFNPLADAKEQLFAHAAGGGFGIRDWLQDAVLALFKREVDHQL